MSTVPRASAPQVHRSESRDPMRRKVLEEIAAAKLSSEPASDAPVTEGDLVSLPTPAQRYLRFMGVVGRPRDWSFRVHFTGRFRRGAGSWMPIEAWQYDTRIDIARVFHIKARLGGLVPTYVRDTYSKGQGRMLGRVFDLFTVVDGTGEELDFGELVTYLNDCILLAPSMLLGPETSWTAVDNGSFDVTLKDGAQTVTARVFVDGEGAVTDCSTNDRFYAAPKGPLRRERWTTPVEGWQLLDGRRLPTRAKAVWQLSDGPLAYAEFDIRPGAVTFNVRPGE